MDRKPGQTKLKSASSPAKVAHALHLRKPFAPYKLRAAPDMPHRKRPQEPTYPDVLPAFLRQSKHDIQTRFIDLEWQQRNRLLASTTSTSPDKPSQWARLTGDEIFARNRYLNVEPFAANRVKLQVKEGVNDYINASPIALGERRYIATQGPKETSTSHFYRMLAQETEGPAVVVMLTQTHEQGREKCFPYFPDSTETPLQLSPDPEEGDDGFEGSVTLLSLDEDKAARTTIRKLLLKTRVDDGPWREKTVWHLLFGGWPDFSIPEGENRDAMLKLIDLSARLNAATSSSSTFKSSTSNSTTPSLPRPSNIQEVEAGGGETNTPPPPPSPQSTTPQPTHNPRIVHCSAGVGRSGTFIALDYLFAQLARGEMDNVPEGRDAVAETVDLLRQQRMMMVQGESQFFFLYDVLRDAWLVRWRERNGGVGGGGGNAET